MSTGQDETSIVCFDGPDCTRKHAGGAGGVLVHPPAGARISGCDGPLIPLEPDAEHLNAASLIAQWNTAMLGLKTHEQRTKAYEDAVLSLAVFIACDEGTPEAAQSILAAAVAAVTS